MESYFAQIMVRSSMSNVIRKALENAATNHYSNVEQASNALLKIEDHYFCNKKQMELYGKNLRRLCKEYFIPPKYNERILSSQGDTAKKKKVTQERIASEIGIARTHLASDLNAYRIKAQPKNKNYIENRQAHLLLYSIFFEVSPLYLIGLTKDKYDYQGPFDFMVTENSDFIACHKLIRGGYARLLVNEEAEPDKIDEYISYLESLKDLAVFFEKNDEATNQQCCHEIWELFKRIPWIDQNAKIPLPVSNKEIEREDTYYLDLRIKNKHLQEVAQDYADACKIISKTDLRILIVYALLVYYNNWELLNGIRNILRFGNFILYS